jgi:hypothetical protein
VLITNKKNIKKEGYRRKTTFEKKNSGLSGVDPSHALTRFDQVITPVDLLTNPDWSSHWADPSIITID